MYYLVLAQRDYLSVSLTVMNKVKKENEHLKFLYQGNSKKLVGSRKLSILSPFNKLFRNSPAKHNDDENDG